MKPAVFLLDLHDVNPVGKKGVQGSHHLALGKIQSAVKLKNLAQGIDARIRSSGSQDMDLFSCKMPDCLFDRFLYGISLFLGLPSAETAAFIGNRAFIPDHLKYASQIMQASTRTAPARSR